MKDDNNRFIEAVLTPEQLEAKSAQELIDHIETNYEGFTAHNIRKVKQALEDKRRKPKSKEPESNAETYYKDYILAKCIEYVCTTDSTTSVVRKAIEHSCKSLQLDFNTYWDIRYKPHQMDNLWRPIDQHKELIESLGGNINMLKNYDVVEGRPAKMLNTLNNQIQLVRDLNSQIEVLQEQVTQLEIANKTLAEQSVSNGKKLIAICMYSQGYKINDIADKLDVNRKTVSRWITKSKG